MGSIIERSLSNGEVSHQAMVKIPRSKAAVKTFKDRANAQEFIDGIERGLKIATLIRHKRDKASIHNEGQSREEAANAREEQWRRKWLKETLKVYDRVMRRHEEWGWSNRKVREIDTDEIKKKFKEKHEATPTATEQAFRCCGLDWDFDSQKQSNPGREAFRIGRLVFGASWNPMDRNGSLSRRQ